LKNGVITQLFFTFFLFLFLVAIGLRVGKNIGMIFKKYGIKFVIIGAMIPCVSMLVMTVFMGTVLKNNQSISSYEAIGTYAGAMTSTPAYGTALDAAAGIDIASLYQSTDIKGKQDMLNKIDSSLKVEEVETLTDEQIAAYKTASESGISLGYTVGFPFGVLVIVILISVLPKIFKIDIDKEMEQFEKELSSVKNSNDKIPAGKLDFISIGITVMVGYAVGNITIPLGSIGDFSLGGAGGILLAALIFSHIGKIGSLSFRMDDKSLGIMSNMGLTFFMAVVGLRYGYAVINAFTGSGLILAVCAIFVEAIAVMAAFFVGRNIFGLNWIILSGAICGGCTSAPGLGAAISSVGSDEPSTGYGAAQPFAILANVLLTTIFFSIFL